MGHKCEGLFLDSQFYFIDLYVYSNVSGSYVLIMTVSFEIGKCWVLQYWYSFSLKNFFSNWVSWVFLAAHGISLVMESRDYSSLQCTGFSLQWLLLLQSTGSAVVAHKLHCDTWNLPRPGIKPLSPALAGGFSTSGPPGKSPFQIFCSLYHT